MSSDDTSSKYDDIDAESLIEAFGGIRPMAQKLDIAVSTIQGWKARNHIPPSRMEEVLNAAKSEGVDVASLTAPETIEGEAIILDDQSSESLDTTMNTKDANEEPKANPVKKPAPASVPDAETPTSNGIAWLALIMVIFLGAAVLSRTAWAPIVDPKVGPYLEKFLPMMANETPEFGEKSEAHMAMVARVSALEGAPNNEAMIENMMTRIATLEADIKAIPTSEGHDSTDSAFDALDDRLIKLEKNIVVSSNGETSVDLNDVNQKLAMLELALATVQTPNSADAQNTLAMSGMSNSLSQVQDRMVELADKLQFVEQELEAAMTRPTTAPGQRAAALIVSISQLESDVLSGQIYGPALRSTSALSNDENNFLTDIAALQPYADNGVATRLELNRRFAAIAPDADATYRKANADDWMDETLENIRGLVSVRRIGDDPDLPPVSRIEAALKRGDLKAAIAAAEELSDSELVSSWLIDAQARFSVEMALVSLRATAISLLSDANVNAEASE